jgi:UDP-N-acetylmuramoyl-tripeptide--D-alanyl-D-alanine ligase
MSALWTLQAMREAMSAETRGAMPHEIVGLSIDSRTIGDGEAYFAIKGDVHDGHSFVAAAIKNGASVAVVEQAQADKFAGLPLLVVPDVLDSLGQLARASRARFKGRVIAVTGSVGKTSTKEGLRCVLSAQGETHASVASFNNHWGVPLSLARCPAHVSYAVFEIGMNHAGEIEPLVKMVRPHVAVVTTVEPVHLEFFQSVEAIADAKAEIFLGVEPGGAAVLNLDNPQFARLRDAAQNAGIGHFVTFGEHAGADARLLDVSLHAASSAVHAKIFGHDVTYKLGMPGKHMAMNSLAVLAAATHAGADLARSALALSQMQPPAGRGVRARLGVGGGEALLIDESYNANPASMRAAISVLGKAPIGPRGRRIAILGDMLELGPNGAELHAALAESLRVNAIDLVFCCGPLMRSLWEALPSNLRGGYAESSATLESEVAPSIRAGDALMIKGSLGSKMKLVVEALHRRFPAPGAFDDVAV